MRERFFGNAARPRNDAPLKEKVVVTFLLRLRGDYSPRRAWSVFGVRARFGDGALHSTKES